MCNISGIWQECSGEIIPPPAEEPLAQDEHGTKWAWQGDLEFRRGQVTIPAEYCPQNMRLGLALLAPNQLLLKW